MTNDDQQARSEAARKLGSIRTPKKTAATRANVAAYAARRPLLPCTCGRTESPHTAVCPVGRRERAAKKREKEGEI